MPITIIGEAFRSAWERKEVLEAQMKIQDLLIEQEKTINELGKVSISLTPVETAHSLE